MAAAAFRYFTDRLLLTRMPEDFLDRSLSAADASVLSSEEFSVPEVWLAQKWLMSFRLEQHRADAEYRNWGLWAVVLRETHQMIGDIGFHTPPNAPYLQPYANNAWSSGLRSFLTSGGRASRPKPPQGS